jgi:predicted Zn-dependent protease
MKSIRIYSLIALALGLSACATNPVTGKRELVLMSEQQEIALGLQADPSIVGQYGLYPDEELQKYVEDLGQRMVPVSDRPQLDFHFRLLDDPVVNAFALPGGYIYITRGILAYLNDESGLAGVIGHEIGHVTARHGVQQYTQQTLLGGGLLLGAILSPELGRYMNIAGAGAQMLLLKNGRDDERQSDQLGVQYATKIGYDTQGMANFFKTLDTLTGGKEGRLPEWTSTHPDPGARFETVSGLTQRWQAQVGRPPYKSDRDGFLARIDGIIFGDDPRNGYRENDRFYHPQMKFEFPIPRSWKLQNTAAQVAIFTQDQSLAVVLRLAEESSANAAADALQKEAGVTLSSREAYRLGGKQAVRALFTDSQGKTVSATFIEHNDLVFGMYGLGATNSQELRLVELPADGFREVTDPAVLNKQPIVVRVIQSPREGSFLDVMAQYPPPPGSQLTTEGLGTLNGLPVNSWIAKGQKLKVLVRGSGSS